MTPTDNLNEPINQTETAPETASDATPRPNFVSPIRLEANRRNAQLSTGPRTEAGKQRSRLNARRHGLTGQVSVLPDADRVAIERFCKPIMAEFSPGTEYETQLARAIAESQWRLNRARSIEDNFFANEIARYPDSPIAGGHLQIADALHQASAFTRESAAFDRLTLYEQRIQRAMAKSVQLLKGNSSKWIHEEFPSLRTFGWQDGYGGFTVSKSNAPEVVSYIQNQREHHRKKTFQEEYLEFLHKNGIEYDERYLFD